jgi:hypothetical protein
MSTVRSLFLFLLSLQLTLASPLSGHRTVHVFVALCDNEHQGIVPVAPKFGNGDDPSNNLYWGASFGVRSYFSRSEEWILAEETADPRECVLERCVFQHKNEEVYMVADAYRGKEIKGAIADFLNAAAGKEGVQKPLIFKSDTVTLDLFGNADLLAYVGHNGLMDFTLESYPEHADSVTRNAIIIACISKTFFREAIQEAGAYPLVWTTGLLAAEAYPLKAAIDGWILGENAEEIRIRAARAYHRYQKCGLNAAKRLYATGF